MSVEDRWKGLSKAEMAERRRAGHKRWLRRWRGPDVNPATGKLREHKQSYPERQRAQAELDDARQKADPKALRVALASITVNTLVTRHIQAKADRAPGTVRALEQHAVHVRAAFGDRHVSTLEPTEIEIWATRPGVAAWSRKKQVELLRAAIKRGIRDDLVDRDPTEGIIVSLGHKEMPHWTSEELTAVLNAAPSDFDRVLLGVLGLMGLRSGEARSLRVGDLRDGYLTVRNSGAGTDTTKTRASRRTLPVPESLLHGLEEQAGDRPKSAWLFPSPRKVDLPIGKSYVTDAVTRAVARANLGRQDKIERINVHGLRHTFAAITLSELEADMMAVSRALGHSKPSTTLNEYGHMAPNRLETLMQRIDSLTNRPVSKRHGEAA